MSEPRVNDEPAPLRRRAESAAAAGVVYSILAVVALVTVQSVPPASSTEAVWNEWIGEASNRAGLVVALSLASISAVAFLWFVAVVRRRIGDREDRFFATVFLGSALVHVALWLVVMSILAAPAMINTEDMPLEWDVFRLAEGTAIGILLVAAPRIQAVFVASTSTMFLRTRVVPTWLSYVGYVLAVVMFIVPIVTTPVGLGLPAFVLVASVTILFTRRRIEHDST
ncbi:MAG TPA: hypothetical protein VLG28_02035 [Acidimicrobiia bacterium]|jgi:hypothetical protein|nr:hypothetical protein [Acidimicrobiia bacterium]